MKRKILIVDSQSEMRTLLSAILQKDGYEVEEGSDELDVKRSIHRFKPHLIILDMKLPGKCGTDVLKWIKEASPSTDVIMITAYRELNLTEKALKLGAVACLSKPFDISELRLRVKDQLQGSVIAR